MVCTTKGSGAEVWYREGRASLLQCGGGKGASRGVRNRRPTKLTFITVRPTTFLLVYDHVEASARNFDNGSLVTRQERLLYVRGPISDAPVTMPWKGNSTLQTHTQTQTLTHTHTRTHLLLPEGQLSSVLWIRIALRAVSPGVSWRTSVSPTRRCIFFSGPLVPCACA